MSFCKNLSAHQDVYALLLLYLAISGIFMIKGKLGLKWRGALLISIGVAVPVTAVMVSGPAARATKDAPIAAEAEPAAPAPAAPASAAIQPAPAPAAAAETPAADEGSGIKFLPPEE